MIQLLGDSGALLARGSFDVANERNQADQRAVVLWESQLVYNMSLLLASAGVEI